MDSLTQIVLGAAVGQAAQGKKLGNRAMLWGAVGGTIPDLDIIGNYFMSEIDALAFHRGISHSITFAVLFSFLIAWLVKSYYASEVYKNKYYKWLCTAVGVLVIGIGGLLVTFISFSLGGNLSMWISILLCSAIGIYFIYRLKVHYLDIELMEVSTDYKVWYSLFFWTIFTHPLLDCFTVYGTQLFAPFSDYRVAFNNISVADPMYTVLFLIGLIPSALSPRNSKNRVRWNWIGIGLSSLYMVFTLYNKYEVDKVMRSSLAAENIVYEKYLTNPSILNNVLWSGTAETDSFYVQGYYSFFDKEKKFKFHKIRKSHHLIEGHEDDHDIEILRWFSNQYYSILERSDGRLQFNDMRYGRFSEENDNEDNFIFKFIIIEDEASDNYVIKEGEGGPPRGNEDEMMRQLWNRIKGI